MSEKVATSTNVLSVQLLKDEEVGLIYEQSITTISFYQGKPPTEALRHQFERVLGSNPWLSGELVQTKDGVRLSFPEKPEADNVSRLFKGPGEASPVTHTALVTASTLFIHLLSSPLPVIGRCPTLHLPHLSRHHDASSDKLSTSSKRYLREDLCRLARYGRKRRALRF